MTDTKEVIATLNAKMHQTMLGMASDQGYKTLLKLQNHQHPYSFLNLCRIYAQKPDATIVYGYEAWKRFGRHVIHRPEGVDRGAFGIKILSPSPRYRTKKLEAPVGTQIETDENGVRYILGRPRVLTVYDVSQTEGDPLPDLKPTLLTGDAPRELWDITKQHAADAGYRLELADPVGWRATQIGRTIPSERLIEVRRDVDPKQQIKTALHEMPGHVWLDHVKDFAEYQLHRADMELQAETVAYQILGAAGEDTSQYSIKYNFGWAQGDASKILAAANIAAKAAERFIDSFPGFERLTFDPAEPTLERGIA